MWPPPDYIISVLDKEVCMLDKLQQIRKDYPIPFWIGAVVLLPLTLILGIVLLAQQFSNDKKIQEFENTANIAEGKAQVYEDQADQSEVQADKIKENIADRNSKIKGIISALEEKQRGRSAQSASWDDLDKEAGK